MRRKGFLTVVTLGLVLLLSGCFSKTAEDLFSLPKMPQDYVDLDNTINAVLSELGAEYAAPRTATIPPRYSFRIWMATGPANPPSRFSGSIPESSS